MQGDISTSTRKWPYRSLAERRPRSCDEEVDQRRALALAQRVAQRPRDGEPARPCRGTRRAPPGSRCARHPASSAAADHAVRRGCSDAQALQLGHAWLHVGEERAARGSPPARPRPSTCGPATNSMSARSQPVRSATSSRYCAQIDAGRRRAAAAGRRSLPVRPATGCPRRARAPCVGTRRSRPAHRRPARAGASAMSTQPRAGAPRQDETEDGNRRGRRGRELHELVHPLIARELQRKGRAVDGDRRCRLVGRADEAASVRSSWISRAHRPANARARAAAHPPPVHRLAMPRRTRSRPAAVRADTPRCASRAAEHVVVACREGRQRPLPQQPLDRLGRIEECRRATSR